jgi:hypothetical protein
MRADKTPGMDISKFIRNIVSSPSNPPTDFYVPNENIEPPPIEQAPFLEGEHYFMVRINEMYLSTKRSWFYEYMPLVYTSAEFTYDAKQVETPFVVGKNLLQGQIKDLSRDMLFRDTCVAGWHPYAGGKLQFTILLAKVRTNDYLQRTLNFVEKMSGLFNANVSAMLASAINISKIVTDGINELVDSESIEGLACFRREFDGDSSIGFYPGSYLLLEESISEEEKKKFYVKENKLYHGSNSNNAQPYRRGDYVLFSIEQNPKRSDYKSFPFYRHFQEAEKMASKRPMNDYRKEEIQNLLLSILVEMKQSPDLTGAHAEILNKEFYNKIEKMTKENYKLGEAMGTPDKTNTYWDTMSAKIRNL